jgi:hypothetical protein
MPKNNSASWGTLACLAQNHFCSYQNEPVFNYGQFDMRSCGTGRENILFFL